MNRILKNAGNMFLFFTIIISIILNTLSASGHAQNMTAFVNVNVIPMDEERVLERQTVLVVGDRITQIGPPEEIQVPADAQIIEGEGSYLMPGLADMHMHLLYDADPRHLRLYVAQGVTTVRNLSVVPQHVEWKKQVEQGTLIGPTIFTTGPMIMGAPPGFEWVHSFYLALITVFPMILGILFLMLFWIFSKIMRRSVRIRPNNRKVATGLIVLLVLGGVMAWFRIIPLPEFGTLIAPPETNAVAIPADAEYVVKKQYSAGFRAIKPYDFLDEDTFLAAIRTAKSLGMYAVGHASDQIPLDTVLESGMDEIAHADELLSYAMIGYDPTVVKPVTDMDFFKIDNGKIPEIVALVKKNRVSVTATLVTDENILLVLEDGAKFYANPAFQVVRPETLHRWKTTGRIVNWKDQKDWRRNQWRPFLVTLTRTLHEAGVPILLGTDTKVESIIPGYSVHTELELLVEAGFSPYDALATGTRNAALTSEKMSEDGNWGMIAPGNRADLMLLQNNPLKNVSHTRDRIGVMVRGQWFTQADLNTLVDEYTATFGQ
ncbi:MAG: amidohydrolase family protein [bacterium]|nr:amidohydrolase family protein [bacterium]